MSTSHSSSACIHSLDHHLNSHSSYYFFAQDNILFGLPYDEKRFDRTIHASSLEDDIKVLPGGVLTEIGTFYHVKYLNIIANLKIFLKSYYSSLSAHGEFFFPIYAFCLSLILLTSWLIKFSYLLSSKFSFYLLFLYYSPFFASSLSIWFYILFLTYHVNILCQHLYLSVIFSSFLTFLSSTPFFV